MIVERTESPDLLANAYLVADREGGHAVLIDGNGVPAPLIARATASALAVELVLLTHHHADHVDVGAYKRAFGVPVLAHAATADETENIVDGTVVDGERIRVGDLCIEALHTPGHARGHLTFFVDGTDCFTADVLFKGTVGGTRAPGATGIDDLRASLDRLLALPPETRLHPGHREPTTVGAELERNPFVRAFRAGDDVTPERCTVAGEPAELLLWGPDYDGTNKAWVRLLGSGNEAVVGGSQVNRAA